MQYNIFCIFGCSCINLILKLVRVIMNVSVTHFSNPFSFFLKEKALSDQDEELTYAQNVYTKKLWSDVNHGKYVAVWRKSKWTRGVIHIEPQVLIWLVDCGYYVRPDDSMVYIDLPGEYRRLPTKVFEASIHGVMPIDKAMSEECEITDVFATTWNLGSLEKSQMIISSSRALYFVPVALMSTKGNDVVLGDLYVDIPGQGVDNFIDLMELWPVFLQKDPAKYIENINTFYSSRRKHHACALKPVMPNQELPVMTPSTCNIAEYEAIVKNAPKLELAEESCSDDGTFITKSYNNRLTEDEIEEYSQIYIKFNGIQHNVLNIIRNKCYDLSMCERYKDRKSAGRATTRRSRFYGHRSTDVEDFY